VIDALRLMLLPEPNGDDDQRGRAPSDDRRVKRRDLERHLRAHDCWPIDEPQNQNRWAEPRGTRSVIPRHREIDLALARKICAQLGVPPPTGSR